MRLLALLLVAAALVPGSAFADEPAARTDAVALAEGRVEVETRASGVPSEGLRLPPGATDVRVVVGEPLEEDLVAPDAEGRVEVLYGVPLLAQAEGLAVARVPGGARTLRAPEGWSSVEAGPLVVFTRGEPAAPAPEDVELLARALPFLRTSHPESPAPLVLRADVQSPLVEPGAVVLPHDAGPAAFAEAVAHAQQASRFVQVAPASAAWYAHGEARFLGGLALVAAGEWGIAEVEERLERARNVTDPEARLPAAPAGSTFARQKGLVVVRALDAEIRHASGGRASLADLAARLDAEPEGASRVDNARIEALAGEVAGAPLAPFFASYVYGSVWPATPPLVDAADLVVVALEADAAPVAPGAPVALRFEAANRGTRAGEADLDLRVDDAPAAKVRLALGVGDRVAGNTTASAATPGWHVVTLGGREVSFRVLAPASLAVVRVSTAPEAIGPAEPFELLVYVENAGETSGEARIAVYEGAGLVAAPATLRVEGAEARALTVPLELPTSGVHVVRVELTSVSGFHAVDHEIVVLAAQDTREAPWPAVGAILALALSAAGLRRSRARSLRSRRR